MPPWASRRPKALLPQPAQPRPPPTCVHRDELVVLLPLVHHLHHADGPHPQEGEGDHGLLRSMGTPSHDLVCEAHSWLRASSVLAQATPAQGHAKRSCVRTSCSGHVPHSTAQLHARAAQQQIPQVCPPTCMSTSTSSGSWSGQ